MITAVTPENLEALAKAVQGTHPDLSPWEDLDDEDKADAMRSAKIAWDFVARQITGCNL